MVPTYAFVVAGCGTKAVRHAAGHADGKTTVRSRTHAALLAYSLPCVPAISWAEGPANTWHPSPSCQAQNMRMLPSVARSSSRNSQSVAAIVAQKSGQSDTVWSLVPDLTKRAPVG